MNGTVGYWGGMSAEMTVIPRCAELCLAPMVRVGGLPFRALCLNYGADKVWSEEIIAQRISRCIRIENTELGTVDFVHHSEKSGHSEAVVVFRTDPTLERGRCIFQMGVGSPADALAAARVVQSDVAGIDINMGCPMKFSIQGGMGAALLQKPDVAAEIIKVLSNNLDIPVTAKIRLLDTMEETIEFMRKLEKAGASAISVHCRKRNTRTRDPADWSGIRELVAAVSIPVYANGDFYDPSDICSVIDMGCRGVLLGRPLLLNPSLLRFRGEAAGEDGCVCRYDRFLRLEETLADYLQLCVRYDLPYQLAKYTMMEMMNSGRHTKALMVKMKDMGLDCGRLAVFEKVQSSASLNALLEIFALTPSDAPAAEPAASTDKEVPDAPGGWGVMSSITPATESLSTDLASSSGPKKDVEKIRRDPEEQSSRKKGSSTTKQLELERIEAIPEEASS